jgi:hypothetical protein
MDHLEVLREKIERLRSEIAHILELNRIYRLQRPNDREAQVAHGQGRERLQQVSEPCCRNNSVTTALANSSGSSDRTIMAHRLHNPSVVPDSRSPSIRISGSSRLQLTHLASGSIRCGNLLMVVMFQQFSRILGKSVCDVVHFRR